MANNFTDPFAANLIGLWDFLTGSETNDTGLDDGGLAQNGTLVGGALVTGDQLVLGGEPDRFDVGGEDSSFDLAEGSIITEFTPASFSSTAFQTIINRGEFFDSDTEGYFELLITTGGAVELTHNMPGAASDVFVSTGAGFFDIGDTLRATYTWSPSGGGFFVENLTAGTSANIPVTATDLSLDIGGNDGTSFTFGARENVDDEFLKYFEGRIDYVAVYDARIDTPPPGGSDGIVEGTPGDDLIDTSYTGDPDGDFVDNDDSIFPPVGSDDDIILADGGDDTIRSGDGADDVAGGDGNDDISTDGSGGGSGPDRGFPGVPGVPAVAGDTDPADDRDTVDGGRGDDTIVTGDDNDSILGGDGADSIDGGIDDDTISGGDGDDTIIGGEGRDSVEGGAGADFINTSNLLNGLVDRGFPAYNGLPAIPADPVTDNDLDTVFGCAGDDTILTSDDEDLIFGGAGADSIDAGIDDDSVSGGDDDDIIIGGEGADTLDGDAGDDTIYGGLGPSSAFDALEIRDDLPGALADPHPDNGTDLINGGAGNDLLFGQDDNDTLIGGAGNDTLDGGIDEDSMFGGDDRDLFVNVTQGDTIDGGEGGDDFDTLDLRGAAEAQNPGGRLFVEFSSTNPENGIVRFFDDAGTETGATSFVNIERVICFTPGSLIATPRGERPVEDLRPGDKVMTRDNGIQTIRWAGARRLTARDLAGAAHLAPVMIRKGALGNNLPERDMMLSPNHRMLVANEKTSYYLGESEVLVAAKHLVGLPGITRATAPEVTYVHFLCDQHEVVLADGSWSESFQPGDYSLAGLGDEQRHEIFEIFPDLKTDAGVEAFGAARRSLKRHEAVLVVNG